MKLAQAGGHDVAGGLPGGKHAGDAHHANHQNDRERQNAAVDHGRHRQVRSGAREQYPGAQTAEPRADRRQGRHFQHEEPQDPGARSAEREAETQLTRFVHAAREQDGHHALRLWRIAAVRDAAQSVDPQIPVFNVKTMEERMDTALAQPRFYTLRRGLLQHTLVVVGVGAAVGVAGAITVGRFLQALVRGAEGATLSGATVAVAVTALVSAAAVWSATRRVAHLDISGVLRANRPTRPARKMRAPTI